MTEQTQKLIWESKNGNQRSFEQLIRQHQNYCFRIAFRILLDEDEAKDAVQESLIKLWKNLHKFDYSSKFTTWLYKIVFNSCMDKIKMNKRKANNKLDNHILDNIFDADFSMQNNIENKDMASIINELTNQLDEKQRIVFTLRDFESLSINEIAELMNSTENTVKVNLFYARKNINKKLKKLKVEWGAS
ncbi:MAG: RNA polymerase sigma factor [Melioribacteraceae bacterium]|nr:RNA polymerase sigma factor [Melioribacteraceae bacterium]MCF8356844.1 RNA polymerase sigma factor [Melioribacteraceae bacterium]MCF8396223.1 RNA polymerase sigma factor [Melioribacteraceae bacterium]MCF8421146.1 RNA polymerase sigma factor [Melioribacteraceae bacterium]